MNEALKLQVGHKVLEVGTGCGWHAATVAEIISPSTIDRTKWGHVYSLEIISNLVERAKGNINRVGYSERVTVLYRDGSEGYPEKEPFDRIFVTAAAPYVPSTLKNQLKPNGIIVIPIGKSNSYQTLIRLRKIDDKYIEENLGSVVFVPLTGRYGQNLSNQY